MGEIDKHNPLWLERFKQEFKGEFLAVDPAINVIYIKTDLPEERGLEMLKWLSSRNVLAFIKHAATQTSDYDWVINLGFQSYTHGECHPLFSWLILSEDGAYGFALELSSLAHIFYLRIIDRKGEIGLPFESPEGVMETLRRYNVDTPPPFIKEAFQAMASAFKEQEESGLMSTKDVSEEIFKRWFRFSRAYANADLPDLPPKPQKDDFDGVFWGSVLGDTNLDPTKK